MLLTQPIWAQPTAEVTIRFVHRAGGKKIVLHDSAYSNAFGEAYQLTRLKYYISNARLAGALQPVKKSVHLIDAAGEDSFSIWVKPGTAQQLEFKMGVDSLYNCSGAQDGELDPLKGMFWSWNSGYIFFKLEGYSSSSTADLQRIEHHVGGYLGSHDASRIIRLTLPQPLKLKAGEKHLIEVTLDLDKYWNSSNKISLKEDPVCTLPGPLAMKIAQNFKHMFSLTGVKLNEK
ncbi:MAG: hypothetical protein EOO03_07620 [Chitinophagaceae bacterium]|nr:MAG: hypothetical protein EOO03_07620 [Chitinophagaceae bacterium]